MLNFNIFRMSNKKNKKVLIMAQIQNFGFIASVQEPHVQHTPQPCGGTRQSGGKPEGSEHALCGAYHSGAHRQGSGCDFPVRHDHQQLPD